jgi:diketogulonate reductase-like aldo/keto reductase
MAVWKSMNVPLIPLKSGGGIPSVGFGCAFGNWTGGGGFQGFLPEEAWRSVSLALDAGFRHFDCGHCYGTERHVGDVLGRAMADGRVTRGDLFVTTKLAHAAAPPHVAISHLLTWNWDEVPDIRQRVLDDFERSKEKLGLGTVNLLLMHWPGSFNVKDPVFAREARLAIWETFESLHRRGDALAIGVCNFTESHLSDLIDAGRTVPAVNQIELHPYCQNPDLVAFCHRHGIVVEAYAPFASGAFGLLKDPVLCEIAAAVGKSTGQVILKWHVRQGHVVLPKSGNPARMRENLQLFDFDLDESQMARITALAPAQPKRTTPDPATVV